ncbi:hypothetical protein T484DRAFT_1986737 [Baffinella frigidus]|nr:hypothetical protein T484DRAFT_1986737 [Cryptophyta sp. CCMP2293]
MHGGPLVFPFFTTPFLPVAFSFSTTPFLPVSTWSPQISLEWPGGSSKTKARSYRGTSLIRNRIRLGPYSRLSVGSLGGGRFLMSEVLL